MINKNLVKKLDNIFQMVIRYRDNFECITCGKRYPKGERQQLHAGHFISRGIYSTRWDEENVNAQCAGCNLKQSHADVEVIHTYEKKLKEKYGYDVVDRLIQKKHEVFKLKNAWLEEQIKFYEEELKRYEQQ